MSNEGSNPSPPPAEFTGHTIPAHQVDVRARVGGYVIHVPYTDGQLVTAGSLLFEIDPRPFVAVLARTEAEVARAKAALHLARQELERAERLAGKDAIAVEELERRRTDVETAGAVLASAVAQKDVAALDVEFTRVKAPVSCRVGRALVKPGNLISGGDANGTLLTTLVTVDPLHVLFTVDEPALRRLSAIWRTGGTIRAEVKLGDDAGAVDGTLDYISPALDTRSSTGQARLVVDNDEQRFSAGLFARITVITKSDQPRVLVPETALGALIGRYEWSNLPASFHNGAANVSFADGHAETHRWLVTGPNGTVRPAVRGGVDGDFPADPRTDYLWVMERMSELKAR